MNRDAHAEGKAAAAAVVTDRWKRLAIAARAANLMELAATAEQQVKAREAIAAART